MVEIEKKFRGKDNGTEYMKKVYRADKAEICKGCIGRLRNKLLKEYDARNQKATCVQNR